jgi:hypothetical protein
MAVLRHLTLFVDRHLTAVLGTWLFVVALIAYSLAVPPAPVPGDPGEYTFIPWILGIAHPPGYAFYTLVAAAWQRLVPIGSVAYRTHLLAAVAGALSAVLVYLIVQRLITSHPRPSTTSHQPWSVDLPALLAGLSFAAATDVWQHSIHINAHIITLLLATLSVFVLIEWWRTDRDRWLGLFAVLAGLSPTQHPLLIFAFPAYFIFIVIARPRLFRQPKKLLALIGCFALGLSVFLYYPLRSPTTPFGVSDIRSWDTFIHFVSAEGLRVNLFQFGLTDQPMRLGVFFELLKLQFPTIGIVLMMPGVIWLARTAIRPFVLCTLFFLSLSAFIINTKQDVMAYLLLPYMMMAVFIGLGAWAITRLITSSRTLHVFIPLVLLLLPISQLVETAPRVSLQQYTVGGDWVNFVFDRFAGKGEHAVLLAPWEAMTPLWAAEYTEGRQLDPADANTVYVTTASKNPWLDNVFAHLNEGPVYLADYRRSVVEGGLFRLRPEGSWPLWRVVPPGETSVPQLDHPLKASADGIELISYSLDRTTIEAGQSAHLTLAMRAPITPTHIMMPYAIVGEKEYRWTTDSRLLTPDWLPNEVIVERYDIPLPFDTPPGDYALKLGLSDLSAGRDLVLRMNSKADSGNTLKLVSTRFLYQASNSRSTALHVFDAISIETLHVIASLRPHVASPPDAIADFNAQITLIGASANGVRHTPELSTIGVKPGDTIDVWLNWLAEQQVDESYTIFVHLIDAGNQLFAQQDNPPMGGAFPTQLWIPKWIAGQSVSDPYQIKVPNNLPPGEYSIEVGMYGLTSNRRVPIIGHAGGLAGDRVILFKIKLQ